MGEQICRNRRLRTYWANSGQLVSQRFKDLLSFRACGHGSPTGPTAGNSSCTISTRSRASRSLRRRARPVGIKAAVTAGAQPLSAYPWRASSGAESSGPFSRGDDGAGLPVGACHPRRYLQILRRCGSPAPTAAAAAAASDRVGAVRCATISPRTIDSLSGQALLSAPSAGEGLGVTAPCSGDARPSIGR